MNESDDDYYDADDDDYYDDDYYYYYYDDDDDDDDDKEEEEEARGPIEPKPVSMQKKTSTQKNPQTPAERSQLSSHAIVQATQQALICIMVHHVRGRDLNSAMWCFQISLNFTWNGLAEREVLSMGCHTIWCCGL